MNQSAILFLFALLSLSGQVFAHHGDDFILLEDYSMPAVWRPQVTSTLDWEKFGSIDSLQTEPTLYFTPMPRIGFSLAARFADESGDWALSSVTPRIHVQLTDPKSKFPIRVGFSIGYQFGIDSGEQDHHVDDGKSGSHSHNGQHQHSASKKKNNQPANQEEHDHSDHTHEPVPPTDTAPASAPAAHSHADGSHTHAAPVVPVTAAAPSATTVPVTSSPATTPVDPNAPHDHSTHDHGPTTSCDPAVDVDCEGLPLPPPAVPVSAPAPTSASSAPAPASASPTPVSTPPTTQPSSGNSPPAPATESPPTEVNSPPETAQNAPGPQAQDEAAPAQTNQRKDRKKASKSTQEKKKPKKTATTRSPGAHTHSHNENQWIGRLVVEANFGSTKILANLIGVSPEDGSPSWAYAAGVRHQFTHKMALGIEAIGDFVDHGQHEIVLGGYMTPVHSLTFKMGAGFGLTEASPDFVLRSGFVVRF